ncbi:zinc finger CCCH domain-containing protein 19 [Tanacetum coccineum]
MNPEPRIRSKREGSIRHGCKSNYLPRQDTDNLDSTRSVNYIHSISKQTTFYKANMSPSTPPGNDLNIAVESGSSWIDYIGPLTSDEIDSDKRWSYRDPNRNIHGLFSLAQLRSWKDYFPSNLQIWSYYGNVKEAILLHNALSRQTKDAG